MAEENTGMSRGRKILVGFIVVLFLLTIGAYFFGVYYFTEHFLPGTQVNGFNCSYMTQEETEKLLAEETSVYILAIQTRGNGRESISADEIDLKYTSDGSECSMNRSAFSGSSHSASTNPGRFHHLLLTIRTNLSRSSIA